MRVQVDLWDYDQAVITRSASSAGVWWSEWVQFFQRWTDTEFKHLELGTAQYNFNQAAKAVLATGHFPPADTPAGLQG